MAKRVFFWVKLLQSDFGDFRFLVLDKNGQNLLEYINNIAAVIQSNQIDGPQKIHTIFNKFLKITINIDTKSIQYGTIYVFCILHIFLKIIYSITNWQEEFLLKIP